jgi:uncharacterized membrane protein
MLVSNSHTIAGPDLSPAYPIVRKIGPSDIKDALVKGIADFLARPSHLVFLGLIYPLAGIWLVIGSSPPLIFPLLSGFALIGPFAAIGLYEVSRCRELGLDSSWNHAFAVACNFSYPIARPHLAGDLRLLGVHGSSSLRIALWVHAA